MRTRRILGALAFLLSWEAGADPTESCLGSPDCVAVALRPRSIPAGGRDGFNTRCPSERPFFWNWSLERAAATPTSALLSASLVKVRKDPASLKEIGARIEVANDDPQAEAAIQVWIGCAVRPWSTSAGGRLTHVVLATAPPNAP